MKACVLICDFMAAVERRAFPELSGTPLVFLHFKGKQERVFAASRDTEGVEAGMRVGEAQAICPEAVLLAASLTRCASAVRELVETLSIYTHQIEVDENFRGDLRLYLDLGKLKATDGIQLGQRILMSCGTLRLSASVGIAAGKFTAYVAAYHHERLFLVRPGEEPLFLAPKPVDLLPLSRAMRHDLWQYGIERLGQFAALRKGTVLAQFGPEGKRLHQWASGRDSRLIQPYNLAPLERVTQSFEDPLASRSLLDFCLAGMIRTLAQRLERRAAMTEQITLLLQLDRGPLVEKVLQLRKPLSREEEIRRVISRCVEQLQVDGGIIHLELLLELIVPEVPRQLSLFEYAEQQERRIEDDIKQLARRYEHQHFFQGIPGDVQHPQPEQRFRLEPLEP